MASKMVDYRDSPYESEEQYGIGNSSNLAVTLRILKGDIRSCKEDNDRIIQSHKKLPEVNAVILKSFSDLQRQGPLWIGHEQENKTDGAHGSISHGGHR